MLEEDGNRARLLSQPGGFALGKVQHGRCRLSWLFAVSCLGVRSAEKRRAEKRQAGWKQDERIAESVIVAQ